MMVNTMNKRFFSYIINAMCTFPILFFIAKEIYWRIFPLLNLNYFTEDYFLLPIVIVLNIIKFPFIGVTFYKDYFLTNYDWSDFYPILAVIMSTFIVETLTTYFFKGNIGDIIFHFRITQHGKKRPAFWRILIRTSVKYISIAFCCPILILGLVHKNNLFLHDILSGTSKIDISEK